MELYLRKLLRIGLAAFLLILLGIMPAYGSFDPDKVRDVDVHWAKDYIEEIVQEDIMECYPNGFFKPNKPVSRASFIRYLVSSLSLNKAADMLFRDSRNHWANGYIGAAIKQGIIKADEYDGLNFEPGRYITQAEATRMIARVLGQEGLISGSPYGRIKPDSHMTRAETATIIIKMLDKKPFHSQDEVTIAIFGTDERSTETARSDIIMLLKIQPAQRKALIISIPRDTKVEIPGFGSDKINHAYAFGGSQLMKTTLEQLFNTRVDYTLKLGFEEFKAIIDALGGVQVNAGKDFAYGSEVIVKKGEIKLNGDQALFYVRYRSDSEGDFGRIKRQQEVVHSIANGVIGAKNDLSVLMELFDILVSHAEPNIALGDLLLKLPAYTGSEPFFFDCHTLNTGSKKINGIWYELVDSINLEKLQKILSDR